MFHSSKTMRVAQTSEGETTTPEFLKQANELSKYMKMLEVQEISSMMKISPKLSETTKLLIKSWTKTPVKQTPAIDSFLGDMYSGLQAAALDKQDRAFAQEHLRILSGLYGILKPLDGIFPYRLEMAYKLPDEKFNNLYKYWGDKLAKTINDEIIINLSSVEYSKALLPYIKNAQIVTPKFLTISHKTKEPTFVVVHAKIARGAYVHWLIKERIQTLDEMENFTDLNYSYNKKLSTPTEPVFVAKEFGGLGLSVRLT